MIRYNVRQPLTEFWLDTYCDTCLTFLLLLLPALLCQQDSYRLTTHNVGDGSIANELVEQPIYITAGLLKQSIQYSFVVTS